MTITVLIIYSLFFCQFCGDVTSSGGGSKPNIIEGNDGVFGQGDYIFHKIGKNKIGHLIMGQAWKKLTEYNNKKNNELGLPNINDLKLEGDKNVDNLVRILNLQKDLKLNKDYYYANAGTKEENIVSKIDKEVKDKFKSKTLADLPENILKDHTDILAYAYFLVDMKFPKIFNTKPIKFNHTNVKGITSKGSFPSVKVLEDNRKKDSDNKEVNFLLKLNSKNNDFHIVVGKGSDYSTPEKLKARIGEIMKKDRTLEGSDIKEKGLFHMPKLNFFIKNATYTPFIRKYFTDSGFLSKGKGCFIAKMFDNIKFKLDKYGARVEIESVACMAKCAAPCVFYNYILDSEFYLAIVDSKSLEVVLYLYVADPEGFMLKV